MRRWSTTRAGGGPVGPDRATGRPSLRSHPWQADASRARATREAYRARTRRSTGGAAAGPAGSGPSPLRRAGAGRHGGNPRRASGRRPDRERGTGREPRHDRERPGRAGAGGAAGSGQAGRSRRSRGPKATIGSTSYDGADKEPFDPAWEGATWYGAGSGTYWTLNPKEYADPRKHGPEYQARSRRARGGSPSDADSFPGEPPDTDDPSTASTSNEPPGGGTDPAGSPAPGQESSAPGRESPSRGHEPSANARPWPPVAGYGSELIAWPAGGSDRRRSPRFEPGPSCRPGR